MRTYIFFRAETFYIVRLECDIDVIANAERNPGTVRVEDARTGITIWEPKNL